MEIKSKNTEKTISPSSKPYSSNQTGRHFKIPQFVETTLSEFINFWKKEYSYFNEDLYDENIGKTLDEAKILSLYKWKNGNTEISQKKLQSIERIYFAEMNKPININCLEDGREYLEKLEGGAIWNIFWLHCLKPRLFPIFDQHTYRSMTQIKNGSFSEIPNKRTKKLQIYFDEYIPFFRDLVSLPLSPRDIDKALFAYGRFLKKGFSGK
jgi:hypothetical protein